MTLNEILITGETNQEYRTHSVEEMMYNLDKSVQVYFRNIVAAQLQEVITPIYEELSNTGKFRKDVLLFDTYESTVRFCVLREPADSEVEGPTPEELAILEEEKKKKQAEIRDEYERLLRYDSQTYHELYQYVFSKVAYNIISDGGDLNTARDIFQNALIVLLERLKKDDFMLTCKAGSYLHSVSVNIWRNLRRKLVQRVIQVEISDFSNKLQESIYFEEIPYLYEKVAGILEKMGDPCKALLESFYFNQLSWEAIAEKFGYSNAASARNQKYKCLERIRKELV